jgi:hypothetical protein
MVYTEKKYRLRHISSLTYPHALPFVTPMRLMDDLLPEASRVSMLSIKFSSVILFQGHY